MTTAKLVRQNIGPEELDRLRVYAAAIAAMMDRTTDGLTFGYRPDHWCNEPPYDEVYMRFYADKPRKPLGDQLCLTLYQWGGEYLLANPHDEGSLWISERGSIYKITGGAPYATGQTARPEVWAGVNK